MPSQILTDEEIRNNKNARIMHVVINRASYYRANPHRFVEEYLGIHLKLFQQILLWAMMFYDNFLFIAARGIGKTYLTALFAVVRCILYPNTKIVVCSATFKQGKEVILKITDDFMVHSPILCTEIKQWSVGQNDTYVKFKNGSIMRVYVASENSRGARSNILIVDECRMVDQHIVDTVLRPMNATPRHAGYLDKPEYAHLQEMNKEMYLSSAWYEASELFDKFKAYSANFLKPWLKYFVCDLPYQLSIKEGLLMRESIENEMSEATFSDISFMMEREGLFYGSGKDSLFRFNVLNSRRTLDEAFQNLQYYKTNNIRPPKKKNGEKRILSVDIALMASKKRDNDASAFIINSLIPTSHSGYISNIVWVKTKEGLVTEELGLRIMRYFYLYDCDYIALDANGVGMGVLDYLLGNDRYDPKYGVTYDALNVCNNDDLASRCKIIGAKKVIYAIKANAKMNNDMCLELRAGFQNGNINLLADETNIDEKLVKQIKGFNKLPPEQKVALRMPYLQTSFLINELINLKHDVVNGFIKVYERSGMRKDRYSSLEYNYYVAQELARKIRPKETEDELMSLLTIRKAKSFRGE